MKIIKNLITIDLKNKEMDYLFVNGINGHIGLVHKKERDIIENWRQADEIIIRNEFENSLYQKLLSNQYIMSDEDEIKFKNNMINKLKRLSIERNQNQCFAWFVLTYNCNFACPYCYEKGIETSPTISKSMVDKVFADNPNIEYVGLFGGEPLLKNNLDIIKHIISKAPKAKYSIITNGYFLFEYVDILKLIDISVIQVTLDGAREIHNKTRCLKDGSDTYDKVIDGIKKCVENNIPIKIRMNVSYDNLDSCLQEKKSIECSEWGKKVQFELQPLFQCTSLEKNDLYQSLFNDDNVENSAQNKIFKTLSPISDFLYNGTKLIPIIKKCDRDGRNRFYDSFVNIYNCILAVGQIEKSIGKYYPEFLLKEKSFHTRDITEIERCKDCANSLFCGGGCPNGLHKDMDIYTPNCNNFLNDINCIVPIVYNMRRGTVK